MRKYLLLSLFVSLFVASNVPVAVSQAQPRKRPAADAPKQNLSDDFAKASLKALRGVESTLGTLGFQGGSTTVPRKPQELIDDADAEARTDEEKAVVKALNEFFISRLVNNLKRKTLKPPSYDAESEMRAQAAVETSPKNIEMNSREAACSHVLEDMLRARRYTAKPEACYNVALLDKDDSSNHDSKQGTNKP